MVLTKFMGLHQSLRRHVSSETAFAKLFYHRAGNEEQLYYCTLKTIWQTVRIAYVSIVSYYYVCACFWSIRSLDELLQLGTIIIHIFYIRIKKKYIKNHYYNKFKSFILIDVKYFSAII